MSDHVPRSTVRVVISGRVQGVWYRGWTVGEAAAAGLDGWVRNRSDGTVEAVFSGPSDRVAAMIEACRDGPPAARVTGIECFDDTDPPAQSGFLQRPTL
ncbi:acylphosphatase [Nisaea sp.]|uniref:acylphosphatase n=1 Tax=Nisaea sp. TaxID=2024842 RepID=UPI003B525FC6